MAEGGIRTLDDLAVEGRRVLVRVDLNVPLQDGAVSDVTRIEKIVPTVEELVAKRARLVLISHLGRPKGKVVPAMSLRPVVAPLSRALGRREIAFAGDCVGPVAAQAAAALGPGEAVLLENLRFHPGEEANDPAFARALAALADAYVNDAFSVSHRAHASVVGVAELLPAAAGRLLEAEIEALSRVLERPERPVVALIGGAKISTKIGLLGNLLDKVDTLVVGGGMANTLLAAQGVGVGASLCEHDLVDEARRVIERGRQRGRTVLLPTDAVIARAFKPGAETETVAIGEVPEEGMILDIGPQTVASIKAALGRARSAVWNGPLGAFEMEPFDRGTVEVAREMARLTRQHRLLSVAGGGDTLAALAKASVLEDLSYVSTAGGAFLEWLEGKALPGVEVLRR